MRLIEIIDIGNTVRCDLCNADFTESKETGSLVLDASAVCPICQPDIETAIKKYGQEDHMDTRYPQGMGFRAFILKYLGKSEPSKSPPLLLYKGTSSDPTNTVKQAVRVSKDADETSCGEGR